MPGVDRPVPERGHSRYQLWMSCKSSFHRHYRIRSYCSRQADSCDGNGDEKHSRLRHPGSMLPGPQVVPERLKKKVRNINMLLC